MWPRRRQRGSEPHGVWICHGDGRISDCDLIRDIEDDPQGRSQWIASLPPGAIMDVAAGDVLAIAYLPADSTMVIGLLAVNGWAEDLVLGWHRR